MALMDANDSPTATVVGLDYTDTRREYSIIYLSKDWKELLALLSGPSGFFEANQAYWPPNKEKHHAWTLLRPATVILQYAATSMTGAIRNLAWARAHKAANSEPGSETERKVADAPMDESSLEWLTVLLLDEFPDGGFIAEFAANTRTLLIHYLPPRKKFDYSERPILPYDLEYTRASMITTEVNIPDSHLNSNIITLATIHVDIGSSCVSRAQFVVNFVTDCGAALTKACSASDCFSRGKAQLQQKNTAIDPNTLERTTPPKFMVTSGHYPTVIVEAGAIDPTTGCDVCTHSSAFSTDGGQTFAVDSVIVKCYVPPPPPPGH